MDTEYYYNFKKGDKVWIRDYPFGHPINVKGKIVASLGNDFYNVLLKTGLQEGKIVRYKSWSLIKEDE